MRRLGASAERAALRRQGFLLEYTTLGWNIVGAVLVAFAALRADSVALAGFSLDSLIEIFASVIVIWQLMGGYERYERLALRLIACSFVVLAVYILVQAISLASHAMRPRRPAPPCDRRSHSPTNFMGIKPFSSKRR